MTKDTEGMVESLCLLQGKQYLSKRGFGRGRGRASFNGHMCQVPFLLSLKGNTLCFCILFISVATSFSQPQNLLHLKTTAHQYFDSNDARAQGAPSSPEDGRPAARRSFSSAEVQPSPGQLTPAC